LLHIIRREVNYICWIVEKPKGIGMQKLKIALVGFFLLTQAIVYSQVAISVNKKDVCLLQLSNGGFRSESVSYTLTGCTGCKDMEWDVGKGFFYTGSSIYNTSYNTSGLKNVKCKFKTASGAVSTVSLNNAVNVHDIPKISVAYSDSIICLPGDSIILTDNSANISSRQWLVNGVTFNPGPKSIKLGFAPNQSIDVFLSVKDIYGCVSNYLKDSAILVGDSINGTIIPSESRGCAPKTIDFSASIDSGAQSLQSFYWTFQNGSPSTSTSTKRNPKGIRITKADTSDVSLRITSHFGCTYNINANNLITLGDSTNLNIFVSDKNTCAGKPLVISNTNSKTPKPKWSIINMPHTIDSNVGGKIYIRLLGIGKADIRVFESVNGCYSTTLDTSAIEVKGPKAFFTSEVSSYCSAPDTLKYTNNSIKPPGVTNWKWDIYEQGVGRVGGGNSQNFSYITSKLANYTVRLIASGSTGCRDTVTIDSASVGGPLKAGFRVSPHPACPNQSISLIDLTKNKHPGYTDSYRWTFYNKNGTVAKTSTKKIPTHSYSTIGKYSAKLYIESPKGCKDSITLSDTIDISVPGVSLTVIDSTICLKEAVKFYATRNPKSETAFGTWTFENKDSIGDILTRKGDSISFITNRPGRWLVKYFLKDTSGSGCTNVFTMKERLKVSGSFSKAIATPDFGCEPLNTTLKANLLNNWDYDNPTNKPIKWTWTQLGKKSEFVFADSTKQNTTGIAPKGKHYIRVSQINGSGCENTSTNVLVTSGVSAYFQIYSSSRCVGDTLITKNESATWATGFEYLCDSSSVKFHPNKFVKNPKIIFTQPGYFTIRLVTKYTGCTDTWRIITRAEQIVVDFTSADSVSFCAPQAVTFKNLSTGSPVKNYWNFGDGGTGLSSGLEDIGNVYRRNNPLGFDVTLTAENRRGCRDSITKPLYVKVIGPVPGLKLKNNKGCEALDVEFTNTSSFYSRFFIDYDDGSFVDSTVVTNHIYKIQNSSLITQRYLPSILLYDNNNCAAFAYADDTVEVLKKPNANFSFTSANFISPTEFKGCADENFLVSFTNQSQFYTTSDWDFDGDGNIDVKNIANPSYFYRKPGKFVPTIIATYVNGCKDTFSKDTIIALDAPKADFEILTDSICIKTPAQFIDKTVGLDSIIKYRWDFGEVNYFDDTATVKNPKYNFRTPFDHLVNLYVEDRAGCKDQVARAIFISDTIGPKANTIAYATVNPDNSVTFRWVPSSIGNFYSYHVFEETPAKVLQNQYFDISDSIFTINKGIAVNTNRFCYTLQLEDTCAHKGEYSQSHCTILLTTNSTNNYHNELSWLAYDYWDNQLSHYEIWRKPQDQSSFVKITEVSGTRQSFIDSFLCKKEYCYFVKAVNRNRVYTSTSNRACQTPLYKEPEFNVPIELVTIENNKFIKINWKKYPVYIRGGKYRLEKAINNGGNSFTQVLTTANLSAEDLAADFKSASFQYRLRYVDHCGGLGPDGRPSNSIHFSSPDISGTININWNAYRDWSSGVREYKVQYLNTSGSYLDYASVDGNTTTLNNIEVGSFGMDSLCLRVVAVKDTSILVESISNLNCFVDKSEIWVPTAFSPNNDGTNDVFKVFARNVRGDDPNPSYRFSCQVFNRWGQKVFETFDFNQSWDGKFNGKAAIRGLYIVKVYAVGFDGEAFRYNGTLSIER